MLQQPQIAPLHLQENDVTSESQQSLKPETILYHIEVSDTKIDTSGSLQHLLDTYSDVFEEPTNLPPFRQGSITKYRWNQEQTRLT